MAQPITHAANFTPRLPRNQYLGVRPEPMSCFADVFEAAFNSIANKTIQFKLGLIQARNIAVYTSAFSTMSARQFAGLRLEGISSVPVDMRLKARFLDRFRHQIHAAAK